MDNNVFTLIARTSKVLRKNIDALGLLHPKYPAVVLDIQQSLSTAFDTKETVKVMKEFLQKYDRTYPN